MIGDSAVALRSTPKACVSKGTARKQMIGELRLASCDRRFEPQITQKRQMNGDNTQ
jgi:hypothetical protein